MAKTQDEHAGSGLDKPDPKGLLEKLGDTVKSVLPKSAPGSKAAPGVTEPGAATGQKPR